MRDRINGLWSKCTLQQQRVCIATAGLLFVAIVFPPVYAEQVLSGMTDMQGGMVSIVTTDSKGWAFIGNDRLRLFEGKTRLKDPEDMNFDDRWRAMTGPSLAELRAGPVLKVAYGILTLEFVLILGLAGILLYVFRRSSAELAAR